MVAIGSLGTPRGTPRPMPTNIPYLSTRQGILYFRRRVPPRHQAEAGSHEWKKALGRAQPGDRRIRVELRLLTEATDEALALLERGQAVSRRLLDDTLAAAYPSAAGAIRWTLEAAASAHAAERGLDALAKPEQVALAQFIECCGKHYLDEIARADVRRWLTWLRTEREQSVATVRRRLGSLRAIVSHALDNNDLAGSNPFARHRLWAGAEGRRYPFTFVHLVQLDRWFACRKDSGTTSLILRLLRGTGARPLEIGGLDVSDVVLNGPMPVIHIRPNAHRRLKTRSSQRSLPLVGDAVEAARQIHLGIGSGALFPKSCHETGPLSARLSKALRSAGIPKATGFTAYSFRHTLQEGLRLTDAAFDVQQAILGHAPPSTTDRYGSRRVTLSRMADAIALAQSWMSRDGAAADLPVIVETS